MFKKLFAKLKEKRIKRNLEEDHCNQVMAGIHKRYIKETGKQPTEFRMKLNRTTTHFNEWLVKNYPD